MTPTLSVVIPTYKRANILRQCLERLEQQTAVEDMEVIVVSDGEDSETAKMLTNHTFQLDLTYTVIEKSHQGVARNKGVSLAKGSHILFIGDDIFLDPAACQMHIYRHIGSPQHPHTRKQAVLGFTTWDHTLHVTSVMQWLERSGWQFGYPNIQAYAHDVIPKDLQHSYTYTSHISLPIAAAKAHAFHTGVSLYGWEDMEWGLRLARAGIPLFYEPDARAHHHHHVTMEQSLKRMETIGQSAVRIEAINPELHVVPRGFKRWLYDMASYLPTYAGMHRKAFLKGIRLAEQV